MSVIDDILKANDGNKVVSAAVLAHGLMVGDAFEMKLGYSRESALLAAVEQLGPFTPGNMKVIFDLLDQRLLTDPVQYGPGVPRNKVTSLVDAPVSDLYDEIMRSDPADRTIAQEAFIEYVGERLVAEVS